LHHRSKDSLAPSIKKLWGDEELLNAVEQIVGPDISGHPVWNLRIKLPRHSPEEIPWHQDNGYFDAFNTLVCTAWIPLLDTDKSNGGMAVVKGTHEKGILGT
jgi:ectoine hydroxylase-related dioxygenase (phytanoyl-CoA dioxygenase family)